LLSLTASGKQYFKIKQEECTSKGCLLRKVALFSFLGAFFAGVAVQLLLLLLGINNG